MKRIRLISIVVAMILLGGLTVAIFRAREPRYEGRTLTQWIEGADKGTKSEAEWQAASHAVKQMAPDALPFLLRWVQAKDSPQKRKLIYWLNHHPAFHFRIKPAYYYNQKALNGIHLLENEAKPAWPIFVHWTYDTNLECRLVAFDCLKASRADKETLVPVLLRLIQDPDIRLEALYTLHHLYPQEAEAAGVYKEYPWLKDLHSKVFPRPLMN